MSNTKHAECRREGVANRQGISHCLERVVTLPTVFLQFSQNLAHMICVSIQKKLQNRFFKFVFKFFFKFYISTVSGTAAVELSRMAGLFNRSVYYSVELSNFLCELDVIMKYSLYFVWHMKLFFVLFCRRQSQHSIFSQESDETC